MSWSLSFSEPIVLPDGSKLTTLRDADNYLNRSPEADQDAEEWTAAAHLLIEAAEHGGAVAFARIAMLRAIKQQADRSATLELIDLTIREVQQLKNAHVDPISRDQEATLSGVMEVIVAIVSSPPLPVKSSDATSLQREHKPVAFIKPTDDRTLIATETLQTTITKAVKKAEPGCEAFIGVIVEPITPKSQSDANWALRGVKFGRADREKVNKVVTTVIEGMQRRFRISDY